MADGHDAEQVVQLALEAAGRERERGQASAPSGRAAVERHVRARLGGPEARR